jgi:hypothetical protein
VNPRTHPAAPFFAILFLAASPPIVPHVAVMAAPSPAPASAPEAPWPPVPTARYASLEAARDSVGVIVRRCISPADTATHLSGPVPVSFDYMYSNKKGRGWAYTVTVTDTSGCPVEAVEKALGDAGWAESFGYSADGADGTTMGYLSKNFFCLVEGQWDGGDESDPSVLPTPGCTLKVTCVPRREDDVPPQ